MSRGPGTGRPARSVRASTSRTRSMLAPAAVQRLAGTPSRSAGPAAIRTQRLGRDDVVRPAQVAQQRLPQHALDPHLVDGALPRGPRSDAASAVARPAAPDPTDRTRWRSASSWSGSLAWRRAVVASSCGRAPPGSAPTATSSGRCAQLHVVQVDSRLRGGLVSVHHRSTLRPFGASRASPPPGEAAGRAGLPSWWPEHTATRGEHHDDRHASGPARCRAARPRPAADGAGGSCSRPPCWRCSASSTRSPAWSRCSRRTTSSSPRADSSSAPTSRPGDGPTCSSARCSS